MALSGLEGNCTGALRSVYSLLLQLPVGGLGLGRTLWDCQGSFKLCYLEG